MIIFSNIKKLISEIKFSETDLFFENSSADGFALLGSAKQKFGVDDSDCLVKVLERNLILNGRNRVNTTKCTKNNIYTYTLWVCYEYFKQKRYEYLTNKILEDVKSIGCYDNGWQKYCYEEINYIVPNVTSASALIFIENGELAEAQRIMDLLEEEQYMGNWYYQQIKEGDWEKTKLEDSFHLGLMLYHFYKLRPVLYRKEMVFNSLKNFSDKEKWLAPGSIGWSIPMTYLIYNLYKSELSEILGTNKLKNRLDILDNQVLVSLQHKNFRVRAYSAWCLSKIL